MELAELRPKVVGRKKKGREVAETGVGGAPVTDRGAWPEALSGWAGADQNDSDAWSADVDLDAWLDQAMTDVDGVQVPHVAADAGVMLGADAYEEFVATELPAFLGQDAGDDAAGVGGAGSVAGGFDFAGFLPDYTEWEGSVGLFGGEGSDGLFFGEPFSGDAVWPDAGDAAESGALGVSVPVLVGELVGSGYRFLRGVNQANYGSGDERCEKGFCRSCCGVGGVEGVGAAGGGAGGGAGGAPVDGGGVGAEEEGPGDDGDRGGWGPGGRSGCGAGGGPGLRSWRR